MGERTRALESVAGMTVRPLPDPAFWRGRRVLLTGHTGFKGSWLALWLEHLGAKVSGLALPPASPGLFELARVGEIVPGGIVDLRDAPAVAAAVETAAADVVLHLAAQSLVRASVAAPVETMAVNVMGTVNLLEGVRQAHPPLAVLVVTTDKVYENSEDGRPFAEHDPLGGHDPYSASKAAAEIAVSSYARTFLTARGIRVATARGGNVIGGGDFSADRIVPDVVRAARDGRTLELRNPAATRPWQHVLDCLSGYLLYAEALASGRSVPPSLNFGPSPEASLPVADLVSEMQRALGASAGWRMMSGPQPREMQALTLDSRRARESLGWSGRLDGAPAIAATAAWYLAHQRGEDMRAVTRAEIGRYGGHD